MLAALVILAGYLLGSISAAILTCRALGLPDPRSQGSKNPGATNVRRIGGTKAAAITLAGDFAKGLIPVLAARALGLDQSMVALAGLAAFLGHLYPVFFQFQGGKGVATAFGVILGLAWPTALVALAIWLLMAKVFKISSVAALAAAASSIPVGWWLGLEGPALAVLAIMVVLLIWRHRSNIQRLMEGREA